MPPAPVKRAHIVRGSTAAEGPRPPIIPSHSAWGPKPRRSAPLRAAPPAPRPRPEFQARSLPRRKQSLAQRRGGVRLGMEHVAHRMRRGAHPVPARCASRPPPSRRVKEPAPTRRLTIGSPACAGQSPASATARPRPCADPPPQAGHKKSVGSALPRSSWGRVRPTREIPHALSRELLCRWFRGAGAEGAARGLQGDGGAVRQDLARARRAGVPRMRGGRCARGRGDLVPALRAAQGRRGRGVLVDRVRRTASSATPS